MCINKTDKIDNFHEIGWSDPDFTAVGGQAKVLAWLKKFNYYDFVYPTKIMVPT